MVDRLANQHEYISNFIKWLLNFSKSIQPFLEKRRRNLKFWLTLTWIEKKLLVGFSGENKLREVENEKVSTNQYMNTNHDPMNNIERWTDWNIEKYINKKNICKEIKKSSINLNNIRGQMLKLAKPKNLELQWFLLMQVGETCLSE